MYHFIVIALPYITNYPNIGPFRSNFFSVKISLTFTQ